MQVRINVKIFLIALLFVLTGQSKFYAVCMAFLILHELGHLLVGLALGFKPKQLQVMPLRLFNLLSEKRKNSRLVS